MSSVILENISENFGMVQPVKDFNLTVEDKEFDILVGPYGCGKSTALQMDTSLKEPITGNIYIGDRADPRSSLDASLCKGPTQPSGQNRVLKRSGREPILKANTSPFGWESRSAFE